MAKRKTLDVIAAIDAERVRQGMTAHELAERADILPNNLSTYLNYKKLPRIDTVERLLVALNMEVRAGK